MLSAPPSTQVQFVELTGAKCGSGPGGDGVGLGGASAHPGTPHVGPPRFAPPDNSIQYCRAHGSLHGPSIAAGDRL